MPPGCLFKGQNLLNKPITARDHGAILGYVHDIIFDQEQRRVLAFLVDRRWRVESRVLPWSGLYAISLDGVVAHNAAMLTEGVNLLAVRQVFARENIRRGTHLLLRSGRSLGRVDDIYFDEHSVLEGYATVSGGGARDAAPQYVPAPRALWVSAGRALIPDEHAALMEEDPSARRRLNFGLKLLAADLWEKNGAAARAPADEGWRDAALQSLAPVLAREALHLTEGCRVQQLVLAPNGMIAAIAGQIMTPRSIERARHCERTLEALVATGADPLGALRAAMNGGEAPV